MSERLRRRVVPWERRRLAGIFSVFKALFFFVVLERAEATGRSFKNSSGRGEPTENSSGRGGRGEEARARGACGTHFPVSYGGCLVDAEHLDLEVADHLDDPAKEIRQTGALEG